MNSGSSGSPPHSHDAHQHGHDHGHSHGHHHGHGHEQSPADGHGHAHPLQDLSVGLAVLGTLCSSSPTHGMFNCIYQMHGDHILCFQPPVQF